MAVIIRAHRSPSSFGIGLWIFDPDAGGPGEIGLCREVVLETVDAANYTSSAASLDETAAQVLMDSLWECGIRPTDGAGTAGSMRATEKHLKDMRAIVSKKLGVDL